MGNIKMSRLITRQIRLIEQLYGVFEKCEQQSGLKPHEIAKVKSEYDKLIQKYGAQILSVTRILRSEVELPTILKNANFSPTIVKELITQGEQKALEKIDNLRFLNSGPQQGAT
jgi:NTE family protein